MFCEIMNLGGKVHLLIYPPIIRCLCPLIKINYSLTRSRSFELLWYFAKYIVMRSSDKCKYCYYLSQFIFVQSSITSDEKCCDVNLLLKHKTQLAELGRPQSLYQFVIMDLDKYIGGLSSHA